MVVSTTSSRRLPKPDALPPSIDEAAVEATRQITPNLSADAIARIITDAYAEQQSRLAELIRKECSYLAEATKRRLAAEREVREKLVEALGVSHCDCHHSEVVVIGCMRCAALTAAMQLPQ